MVSTFAITAPRLDLNLSRLNPLGFAMAVFSDSLSDSGTTLSLAITSLLYAQRQLTGAADAGFFTFASAALMLMRAARISMIRSALPLCMTLIAALTSLGSAPISA